MLISINFRFCLLIRKIGMFLFLLNKKQLIVSVIIAALSAIGDKNCEISNNSLVAALCDNVTHALIGAFTWIGTFIAKTSNTDLYFFFEIILCGLCSSVIDADHFIVAKSVNLKDAINLKNRPFMHCTTLGIIIVLSMLIVSHYFRIASFHKFGWILAAAFLSHHIRDSKRRGFWLWPFGHTMPIPSLIHLLAQMFLPQLLSIFVTKFSSPEIFKSEWIATTETV